MNNNLMTLNWKYAKSIHFMNIIELLKLHGYPMFFGMVLFLLISKDKRGGIKVRDFFSSYCKVNNDKTKLFDNFRTK